MRVTDQSKYQFTTRNVGRLNVQQLEISERLATGKRINKPSDDPLGAQRARRIRTEVSRSEQFGENIVHGQSQLQAADTALSESFSTLMRVKELGIQGNNAGLTDQDIVGINAELEEMREHLRGLANTRYQETYIFAGFQNDTPPYDDMYAFVGDANVQQVEIGDGEMVDATIPGGAAFGDGTVNTVDIFEVIEQLQVELTARDVDNIETQMGLLEDAIEQLIDSQVRVGVQSARIEAASAVQEALTFQFPIDLAAIEEADFAESVSQLTQTENVLRATLAVSARALDGGSLLDFLG